MRVVGALGAGRGVGRPRGAVVAGGAGVPVALAHGVCLLRGVGAVEPGQAGAVGRGEAGRRAVLT